MKRASFKLDNTIYWGMLITLMNESYMIIVVCVLLNIKIFSMENLGLRVMSVLCAIFLFFSVFLPIMFIWRLSRNFEQLNEVELKRKYGALYEELKLKAGKKVLWNPSFFLLRRMILGMAICVVGAKLIWQMALMVG